MNNEELALQIQTGRNDLYAVLWERVNRLMFKILMAKIANVHLPPTVSLEDLKQEMYFAFCKAVQAYDDTKPYKFVTYLDFHIRKAIRRSLKSNSVAAEYSLNYECGEDENVELAEVIEDETAQNGFDLVELTDIQRITRQAVTQLPSKQRNVIELHFFDGLPYPEIAKLNGCTTSAVCYHANRGLHLLRKNNLLRGIYGEIKAHNTKKDYCYYLAEREWENSNERINALSAIDGRRKDGKHVSYEVEQNVLYTAREQFIKNYLRDLFDNRCKL